MNVFKQFKHFICISLCIILIFTSQFSKPKEVKAIEPVTTLTYATYLLIGGLATMCGVKFASMPKEARYDFISGGFEAIKSVANWTFDERGIATKLLLNEATIKAFLEYVQSKEGSKLNVKGEDTIVSPDSSGTITYKVSAPSTLFNNGRNSNLSILGTVTVFNNCSTYPSRTIELMGDSANDPYSLAKGTYYICYYTLSTLYSMGGMNKFYLCTDKNYVPENYMPGYDPSYSFTGVNSVNCSVYNSPGLTTFSFSAPPGVIADATFYGVAKTVVYNDRLTDVRGIEDYTKQWDKTNVGQQTIEVDGTKTGVDIETPIEGSNSLTDDIVFPAGIEEGVEVPGLKINAGEGSIEASPDTSKDDTLEHQGILQDILDWIGSLFLSLFKFLLDLLEKLIQLLKELLISLFVPSDAFIQEKVDMLKNQLEPKLSYDQYIKLFDSTYEGNELKDIIINIYGQDVVIVKVTLFEHFRDLFNTGVYAVMFFLLAVYNYNNIYKLIRGTDYVSATNTINDATGGTGGSGKGGGD